MKLLFLEAGQIVTTHGVRGQLKVLSWADSPEFLKNFTRVRIDGRQYDVESCSVQKNCNLLKLKGIEDMDAAQALRGKTVEVFREDAPRDLIFAAELIGVNVFDRGAYIGSISEVLDYPGNKVYVVKGTYTYMVPAVKQFILNVDLDANTMQVSLIEGMRTDED